MPGYESKIIRKVINKYIDVDSSILDVACGLGDKILLLQNSGYHDVLGIEINSDSILACKQKGLNVLSFEEFSNTEKKEEYDVILLSHIIEHFQD